MANILKHPVFASQKWRGTHYLISPFWDIFCAGGAALAVLTALALSIPYEKSSQADLYAAGMIASVVMLVQFVINYPHFMVSYQLAYANYGRKLKQFTQHPAIRWRYVNAGIIVPIFLTIALLYTYHQARHEQNYTALAIALHSMQFFVGWHYVKQAYGVFIMHSALNKVYYTVKHRRVFLYNAYMVWLCSWAFASYMDRFLGPAFKEGYGEKAGQVIPYYPFQIPDVLQWSLLALTIISSAWTIKLLWQLKMREKKPIAAPAFIGYGSMYFLFAFATILHPEWALMVPVFHSIQYLMFVNVYRRGATNKRLSDITPEDTRAIKRVKSSHQMFYGWAFLTGALGFYAIPKIMDAWHSQHYPDLLPSVFFLLCFTVFINIHHYFIDNVIWRKENTDVGENIFRWSRKP